MKKLAALFFLCVIAPGCVQIQFNIGANVVNVQKTQVSEGDATMAGSKLEDIVDGGLKADGTVKVTPGG